MLCPECYSYRVKSLDSDDDGIVTADNYLCVKCGHKWNTIRGIEGRFWYYVSRKIRAK